MNSPKDGKTKKRIAIPKSLVDEILYKSAKTCCTCRIPRLPVEVHHIDQNPSNNTYDNLVVLCRNCHSDAHSKSAMSKNLTPERLTYNKKQWEKDVAERAALAMTPGANLSQAVWTFTNHQRLPQILKARGIAFNNEIFNNLLERKIIDSFGIPYQSKKPESGLTTIYDYLEYLDGHRLHYMYCEAVDDLIKSCNPIELGAIWSRTEIKNLVSPGDICFCMRGFRFKRGEIKNNAEDREVYAIADGIEIRLLANTRHMFGSSALYDSFVGNRFVAILMLVKNIDIEGNRLVIRATPLAMGAGFVPDAYQCPYPLKYGWTKFHLPHRERKATNI
ncbi:HNH endonuclease signature motif containing protein [Pseudomonas aeruginosa]|uniref:HNH endonuclease signature motif containing protein n=1 Tax=Pseudomonas aeruginosa TaxID=287 RepID=UPI000F53B836|nr:HNH endonuclease signature motif containing protein [Pseudomonas aeruginosa]MBE2961910.1 HNH endonuclease [Pseudomonas aeruginosa]HEP8235819.1 HNH endonuclease [Pseudomonas aeruginosa]HEP8255351.1 HNH endonuclease [Pseudomonas aeruginosa]